MSETYTERLEEALRRIQQWAEAYPIDVFPEPNWPAVHELLLKNGMSLDRISASNMRHVIQGVGDIARAALGKSESLHDGGTGKLKPYKLEGDTEWRVADCPEKHVTAEPPSAWQPIETAPHDREVLFWVVPLSADETYRDTSGNPITSGEKPRMMFCRFGRWSSLSKAIYWADVPGSPTVTKSDVELNEAEKTVIAELSKWV